MPLDAPREPSSNKRRKQALRERKARRAARAKTPPPADPVAEADARLRASRRGTRNPLDTIRRMAEGERFQPPRQSSLSLVQEVLTACRDPAVVRAALALIHASLGTPILADNPGPARTTIRNVLVNLALRCDDWTRDPAGWRGTRRERGAQLASLIRHVTTDYPVPRCFDQAWTADPPTTGASRIRQYQDWFLHLGRGENLRTADGLPFPLTKRMAHHAMEADDELTIGQALRFGQARALGVEAPIARGFALTRAGDVSEAPGGRDGDAFWASVLRFLAPHRMVDPDCVLPVVDFLCHQRFDPALRPDGTLAPPQPGLTMKGRTLAGLLHRVDAWHDRVARESKARGGVWAPLGPCVIVDERGARRGRYSTTRGSRKKPVWWRVEELLSGRELADEGRALSHCVYSYAWSCAGGRSSIWSLRRSVGDPMADPRWERLVTVEIRPSMNRVVQARGLRNRPPTTPEWGILRAFAHEAGLTIPASLRS